MYRLLLSLVLLSSACANETDDSPNKLVKEKASGACGECLQVGSMYRFTNLKVTQIAGAEATLLQSLNGIWAKDISKAELNIVLKVVSVDAEEVHFAVLNGARTLSSCVDWVCCTDGVCKGDEFCLLPDTQTDMIHPITEKGLGESSEAGVAVYSGSQSSPKQCTSDGVHAIEVGRVVASAGCSGICEPAASDMLSGVLVGTIGEQALKAGCTCLELGDKLSDDSCGNLDPNYVADDGTCKGCGKKWASLEALILGLNGKDLIYDCETATGEAAACVTAEFDAVRLETIPDACP